MRPIAQFLLTATLLASLTACDKMADSSNAAAEVTGNAVGGAITTWVDALTYHPPTKPAQPQTRYCYKNMDDVVCYDSVQPTLTSKLVGYQDGTNISWVQQGGGSLGASGGAPVSYLSADADHPQRNTDRVISVKTPIESDPGVTSYHQSGEIESVNLPPRSY